MKIIQKKFCIFFFSEKFWSKESLNDVKDMYRRQGFSSILLQIIGVGHITQRFEKVEQFYNAKIKNEAKIENEKEFIEHIYTATSILTPSGRVDLVPTRANEPLNGLIDCIVPESYEYLSFSTLLDSWILEAKATGLIIL